MTRVHVENLFLFTWENSILLSVVLPFMVGAAFGSFLNVVILRARYFDPWSPEYNACHSLATLNGRSFCPTCNSRIPLWQNVPAFSWLILRGRSACCNTKLSPQYLIVEWLFAFSFLGLCHFGTFPDLFLWFSIELIAIAILCIYLKFRFVPKTLSSMLVVIVSLTMLL